METNEVIKFEFESAQARVERCNVRLWKLCILLIFLLCATNLAWIFYESQFTVETTEKTVVSQEIDTGDGNAAIYDGVHIGENKTDSCNSKN